VAPAVERKRIQAKGVVQGVGFRPFIYRLATSLGLHGHVQNVSDGVLIEVGGPTESVASFLLRLPQELPPLARIDALEIQNLSAAVQAAVDDGGFTIHESLPDTGKFALVPADISTCDECVSDFTDPANRRSGYPFTNCTNCGPRYTIIEDTPYDRAKTTMSVFPMCPECQAEYEDPMNRRFHAEPNACARCGPSLEIEDSTGEELTGTSALERARALLKDGSIVAIKGLGGFHLACDAANDAAVRRLRDRKRRSDKAFALMVRDVAMAEQVVLVEESDRRALLNPRRPIVLMPRRSDSPVSPAVAPGNNYLGVMLPYTPLHHLLFGSAPVGEPDFIALVMTSGNLSEEPIVSRNPEARPRLHSLADVFLMHNRDIQTRVDDSVVRTFEGRERVIRRSRGYAPQPIDLDRNMAEILACGAQLKSTFCLTKDCHAILSQHIGDLENLETLEFYRETLEHMKRFFRVSPRAVAHDLHPEYMSTKFALEIEGVEKIGIQHHHAHIASCMAENHLHDKVIGVAFDGTGYGTDGRIWGGEFLVCDYSGFERRAHLRYVPLAGGDAAVRAPWRIGLAYLKDAFGADSPNLDLPLLRRPPEHLRMVNGALEQRINVIDTSSAGRLFDAVSSIAGLRQEITYEGQAAIELEMKAAAGVTGAYPYEIESGSPVTIDTRPLIRAIARDAMEGIGIERIAAMFHNTISQMILDVALRVRNTDHLNQVCLSGGTFQNMYLLDRTVRALSKADFEVFTHSTIPANDGGISLGQAVIANEIFSKR